MLQVDKLTQKSPNVKLIGISILSPIPFYFNFVEKKRNAFNFRRCKKKDKEKYEGKRTLSLVGCNISNEMCISYTVVWYIDIKV